MQRIEAIIRPEKLQIVKTALEELDHGGMTLTEVRGHGTQRGITEQWRGQSFSVEYLTKVKIELDPCATPRSTAIIDRIVEAARTGEVGDGKIFVTPVAQGGSHPHRRHQRGCDLSHAAALSRGLRAGEHGVGRSGAQRRPAVRL